MILEKIKLKNLIGIKKISLKKNAALKNKSIFCITKKKK